MEHACEPCGQTDGKCGRAPEPGPQWDLTLHGDLHRDHAHLIHHDAVQVQEADDAGGSNGRLRRLFYFEFRVQINSN